MYSQQTLLNLIDLIYEASTKQESWPIFLNHLSDVTKGDFTTLFLQDLKSQKGNFAIAVRIDPQFSQSYAQHYSTRNVWLIQGKEMMHEGNVLTSQMMCPDDVVRNSEFYSDWLHPQKLLHHFGGIILKEDLLTSNITVTRRESSPPFGKIEIALLQKLMPHLKRSLQIYRRFSQFEMDRIFANEALNKLPMGIILTDSKGKILMINRSAQNILDKNDGLSCDRDGIRAARLRDTSILRSMIANATNTAIGNGMSAGGQILIARPSLHRPFSVLVSPLRCNRISLERDHAAAVLMIDDPEAGIETSEQQLRRVYGLTHCEAILAMLILQGKTIRQASTELEITLNTARTQLKSIFLKTDCHSQVDLIRLILSGHSFVFD